MKLEAGDVLEFERWPKSYVIQKTGNYSLVGKVIKYNGIALNIDWSELVDASDAAEAVEKAIEDIRKRLSNGVQK